MMHDLPFVDAHVHLWDLAHLRYPWLMPPFSNAGPNGSVEPIAANYLLEDYLAESAGWNVLGMVHVEAGAAADEALAETDWIEQVRATRARPSALVAFAALDDPQVEPVLAAQAQRSGVRGIRQIVNWHQDARRTYIPRDVTADEAWCNGFALLGKYGLSFDLQAYPGQFPHLARLIARHPETPVIVNHAGMGVDGRAEWRAGMTLLAALAHVSVKVSGIGFAVRPWNDAEARARIRETIDIFGVERALFASDFPTDRLFASFDRTLGTLADATSDFTEAERRALWGRNANRVYRLGLDV
jgi:predicted TIM-barrel fold metal-dependent hydrolase